MKKILFVCTGNTCRSPMAAAIFNSIAAEKGLDWFAESAGVAAVGNRPASLNAVKALGEIGIDISGHMTRFLPALDLNEYSMFVALNDEHYEILRTLGIPDNMLRLLRRAPNVNDIYDIKQGITDPYGGDILAYRKCRDDIIGSVKVLITTL